MSGHTETYIAQQIRHFYFLLLKNLHTLTNKNKVAMI